VLDLGDPVFVSEYQPAALGDRGERDSCCLVWFDRVGIIGAAHAGGHLARQQQGHPDGGVHGRQLLVERLAEAEERVLGRDIGADAGPGGDRGHRSGDEQLGRLARL
jgi:hypothetical protein